MEKNISPAEYRTRLESHQDVHTGIHSMLISRRQSCRCARHERHLATNVVSVIQRPNLVDSCCIVRVCVRVVRQLIRYDFTRIPASSLAAAGSSSCILPPRFSPSSAAEVDDQFRRSPSTSPSHFGHLDCTIIIPPQETSCDKFQQHCVTNTNCTGYETHLFQSSSFRQCHPICIRPTDI